jgi:hypothetical protein
MKELSFLRFVPPSSATIPIDWSKIPEASKKFFLEEWGNDSQPDSDTTKKSLFPATIDDLAKTFHEARFFGYMSFQPKVTTLLLDISEFGLAEATTTAEINGLPIGPHFYMKHISHVRFILFMPGQRDGMAGSCPILQVINSDEGVERDRALAKDFEGRLYQELRRWGAPRVVSRRVAGWEGFTFESILENAQMSKKILKFSCLGGTAAR